jgi:threonylcarbamoyladenosine tRNA methylthiotransferase MtaB
MKIFFDSIGCRLNQSEIEKMAAQFLARGHKLVESADAAELIVINTCAVTGKAVSDSRTAVRKAAAHKGVHVVTTGCWATLEPEKVLNLAERITVVENFEKDNLVDQILGGLDENSPLTAREPIPGERFRTRAFIKVQDGCDQHCTFCITRIARGKSKSIPMQQVIADVQWAIRGGTKEVVLTGVNLGAWGKDFQAPQRLYELMKVILNQTSISRLRLSSLEPWDLDEDFFSLWENEMLCPQLHLPLQSGSDAVLNRMGRQTSRHEYTALVSAARQIVPDIAISTDMIVGFPGETDAQFEESMNFIQQMEFASGHVFAFSSRPGTAASRLTDPVSAPIIKMRSRQMHQMFKETGLHYREQFLGSSKRVLWESSVEQANGLWLLRGLSDHGLRIKAVHDKNRWNEFDQVRLERLENGEFIGILL